MKDKKKIEEIKNETVMKAVPIVALVFLIAAVLAYGICRGVSKFYYDQKWKDYDECGLG